MNSARNIRRLPSGRFQVRTTDAGGKRIKESFDTFDQARQFRDTIDLDRRLRKHGMAGLLRKRPRVVEVLRDFLDAMNERRLAGTLAPGTLDHYWQCSAGWRAWVVDAHLETLRADELDDALITRYVGWRQGRPLSAKATRVPTGLQVRKDLTHMVRVLRWAGIQRNWSIPRTLPRRGEGKRILPPEQLFAFLGAMTEGSIERTVCELAIATGLRPSDLYALDVDQLDLVRRELRLVTKKDGKTLLLPFEEYLAGHLRLYMAKRMATVHRRLFHIDGRPLRRQTLRARYRKASKAAEIVPPIESPGGLRNAFLAYLRADGVAIEDLRDWVGHTDTRTTEGYIKSFLPYISLKAKRRVAKRVDRLRQRSRGAS